MSGSVYSPLKVFAFEDHAAGFPTNAPVHVRIKPINACNHRCWFCAYRAGNLSLGEEMALRDRIPFAKMQEIACDLVGMGVRAVTFSGGGEPLLYRGLEQIVERLGRGGVRVATLTNGAFLRDEIADAFAEYGTWVRVSMDGWDDESYQRFRGVKAGEYTRIAGNLRRFAARNSKCALGVSLIVSRENAGKVAEICRALEALGVGHVKISPCIVGDTVAENDAYHQPIAAQVRRQIEEATAAAGPQMRIVDHYHGFGELFAKPYATCPMLEYLTVIGADCSVYTCQDKAYRPSGLLGSIAERSFREFWESDERRTATATFSTTRCDHHCVAHRKNLLLHEFRGLDSEHVFFV